VATILYVIEIGLIAISFILEVYKVWECILAILVCFEKLYTKTS